MLIAELVELVPIQYANIILRPTFLHFFLQLTLDMACSAILQSITLSFWCMALSRHRLYCLDISCQVPDILPGRVMNVNKKSAWQDMTEWPTWASAAVSWKLIVFRGNGSRPPKWSAAVSSVIASSPSDVSRAGQSVSDIRTLRTYQRDLAAAAASPAIHLSHGTTGNRCGHRRH